MSETWEVLLSTLVSPLVTIRYHKLTRKSIGNIVQSKQNAIVQNTDLRDTRTKTIDKPKPNLI